MTEEPFVLGVNYWPRRKAMYWWTDFEQDEVRDEFALIADLGLNVVRIFLLWDDFQPTPDRVSSECLRNLATVCDIAADNNLGLDVTFFTGHMSGPNWSPRWLLDENEPPLEPGRLVSEGRVVNKGYQNYFTDNVAQNAQKLLLKTVVAELKDHPAIWMWNLGNEPDLFAIAPDRGTGRRWVQEMTNLIKSIDGQHPVTCGLHVASLNSPHPLRADDTFSVTDVATMHTYSIYTPWLDDPLDPNLVPYTCALTSALCGKPTLMEEFGGCTAPPGEETQEWEWLAYGKPLKRLLVSEKDLAGYIERVLPRLVEVGATGALIWCFADYVPELYDRPPCVQSKHERFFGLVRPDGSLKPHAEVLKKFAASKPTVQSATRTVKLDVSPDEYYEAPDKHYRRLYASFLGKESKQE